LNSEILKALHPVLDLVGVSKEYHGLRPLRLERLAVVPGERIAIVGLDRPAGEVFVNLVTGASLPDTGDVTVFGRSTASIVDATEWLALLDRVGIISDRAVLLDGLSVVQNLAVPFTLELEPPPAHVRERAIALAREVGLPDSVLNDRLADLEPAIRLLVRFGRSLALDPDLLLAEHPTASLPRAAVPAIAERMASVATRRGTALVAATADEEFAHAVSSRVLLFHPSTGQLTESTRRRIRRM
jgi:predicted ABC-type transport system involved in lysophospholipase L1 biosynthesis ATPase subunit